MNGQYICQDCGQHYDNSGFANLCHTCSELRYLEWRKTPRLRSSADEDYMLRYFGEEEL